MGLKGAEEQLGPIPLLQVEIPVKTSGGRERGKWFSLQLANMSMPVAC